MNDSQGMSESAFEKRDIPLSDRISRQLREKRELDCLGSPGGTLVLCLTDELPFVLLPPEVQRPVRMKR